MSLDFEQLRRWMDKQGLPGNGEELHYRFLSGGTQNEIYEIQRGEDRCVIRIPPPGAPADRDKGIMREWRIIQALEGTDVPHVAAIAVCEDPAILGRPFYLMGYVDGWSPVGITEWPAPFDADIEARSELGYQLVEGIALLSKVDWKAKGLEGLGRPEGFHERQVERWTNFFEGIKGREIEGIEVASAWLREHQPIDYVPGIMHGDYQFANVMFREGAPAKLAALIDWEMGTVGDPKLDLGWMIQSWPEDTNAPQANGFSQLDSRGLPQREQLLTRYAEVSERQVDDIDYYVILAKWKLAIVLERGFQRAEGDEKLLIFGPIVVDLMKGAADLAETTDYGR